MTRVFTPDDGLVPVDLIHCGLDHLDASKALFASNPSHFDSAGYLAHIGMELLLKGWQLYSAKQFDAIHSCEALYQQTVERCGAAKLADDQGKILKLLDKYESLRYPNRKTPTEVGDESWIQIEALVGQICRAMPKELTVELEKVKAGTKAGRVLMRRKIEDAGALADIEEDSDL